MFKNGTLVLPDPDLSTLVGTNASLNIAKKVFLRQPKFSLYLEVWIHSFSYSEWRQGLQSYFYRVDTNWMLKTEACEVFRESTYDKSVCYAISLFTAFDKSRRYDCSVGHYWASTNEESVYFKMYF